MRGEGVNKLRAMASQVVGPAFPEAMVGVLLTEHDVPNTLKSERPLTDPEVHAIEYHLTKPLQDKLLSENGLIEVTMLDSVFNEVTVINHGRNGWLDGWCFGVKPASNLFEYPSVCALVPTLRREELFHGPSRGERRLPPCAISCHSLSDCEEVEKASHMHPLRGNYVHAEPIGRRLQLAGGVPFKDQS